MFAIVWILDFLKEVGLSIFFLCVSVFLWVCFDKSYLCLSILWVFLLLILLLFFLFFPLLCYMILVLYNKLKEIDHCFDRCENISVVRL